MLLSILIFVAVFGLPLLLSTVARLVGRGRSEFRARVLETIASAVRREMAIEPQFLWLIAHDERGRRRRTILHAAHRLDEGLPLSEALADTLGLSPAAKATIASAEGGARLDDALRSIARQDRESMEFAHGVLLRLAYPMIILGFLGGFIGYGIAPKFRDVVSSMDMGDVANPFVFANEFARGLAYVFAAGVVVTIAGRTAPIIWLRGIVRGRMRNASNSNLAAWMGALAAAVRAGRPLAEGLDRTADALGHARHAAAVRRLAERLDDGEPVAEIWAQIPAGSWLRGRASMIAGTPDQLAATLDELAALATERSEAARARFLAVLAPTSLLLCGLSIALVMGHFFVLLGHIRASTVIG